MSLTPTEQRAILEAFRIAQTVRHVDDKLRHRPRTDSPYIDRVADVVEALAKDAFDFEQMVRRIAGENAIALPA